MGHTNHFMCRPTVRPLKAWDSPPESPRCPTRPHRARSPALPPGSPRRPFLSVTSLEFVNESNTKIKTRANLMWAVVPQGGAAWTVSRGLVTVRGTCPRLHAGRGQPTRWPAACKGCSTIFLSCFSNVLLESSHA